MQKLILLTFGLLFSITNLIAQSKTTKTAEKTAVLAYYKTINQAELAIVDDDFKTGLFLYKQAFSQIAHPFAIDYDNALLCSLDANNFDFALEMCKKLALKGVEWDYFNRASLDKLRETTQWKTFETEYDGLAAVAKKRIDWKLRAKITQMIEDDQKFRRMPANATMEEREANWRKNTDTLTKIDKRNFAFLDSLFRKSGFPDEEQMGIFHPQESAVSLDLSVLITHHIKDGLTNYIPYLEQSVLEGKMHPRVFIVTAGLDNQNPERIYSGAEQGEVVLGQIKDKLYIIDPALIPICDKNRAKIGLCPLADVIKKTLKRRESARYRIALSTTAEAGIALDKDRDGMDERVRAYWQRPIEQDEMDRMIKFHHFIFYKQLENNSSYFKESAW
jgi:hypothetical protein